MNTESLPFEALERQVAAIVGAGTPTDVFKFLLEGARLAAPRASVFLLRQKKIKGWGSVGFGSEGADRQRRFESSSGAGWLGRLAASAEPLHTTESPGEDLDFGQVPSGEWYGMSVEVKQRPIALIVAERAEGESPWHPAVLRVLIQVARLRLDLDLLRRKSQGTAPAADAPAKPKAHTAEPPRTERDTGLSPAEQDSDRAPLVDEGEMEAARRYARLVATDIRLYNEEAVMLGRQHGDLAGRLGEHLGRGKETFLRRHGSLGPTGLQVLHEAYVQVLAAGNEEIMPRSVLD
jgi:hypothetical protein